MINLYQIRRRFNEEMKFWSHFTAEAIVVALVSGLVIFILWYGALVIIVNLDGLTL